MGASKPPVFNNTAISYLFGTRNDNKILLDVSITSENNDNKIYTNSLVSINDNNYKTVLDLLPTLNKNNQNNQNDKDVFGTLNKDDDNKTVSYRLGTLNDLDQIMYINSKSFYPDEIYDRNTWYMLLNDKTFFVALYDNQIVGYNICCHLPQYHPKEVFDFIYDKNIPKLIMIMSFAVSQNMRNKGIGHGLMQIMLDYFQQKAPIVIGLEARKSNKYAFNLYTKNGFTLHDIELHEYYKIKPENGLFMYKYLI